MSTNPVPSGRPSPLVITLISVCGVLLLALVAVVFLVIGQNSRPTASDTTVAASSNTASATPSPEPAQSDAASPAQTQAPKPVDTSTRFTSFKAPTTIKCDYNAENHPSIVVSWASANAVKAYWAPHKGDASDGTGYQIPLSGNQNDIQGNPHEYDCGNGDHQDNTITLIGPKGQKVSKSWTITELR